MDTEDKLKWLGTQIPVASSLKLKSHADELKPLSAEFFFTENNFLQPIFKQFCELNLLYPNNVCNICSM